MEATIRLRNILDSAPVRWLLALGWTLWLSIILIQPEAQPVIDLGLRPAPFSLEREIAFTIAHIVAFMLTTTLWSWAFVFTLPPGRALQIAIAVALLVGVFTETMQTFAPDRYPSLVDYLANVVGVLIATLALRRHPAFRSELSS